MKGGNQEGTKGAQKGKEKDQKGPKEKGQEKHKKGQEHSCFRSSESEVGDSKGESSSEEETSMSRPKRNSWHLHYPGW